MPATPPIDTRDDEIATVRRVRRQVTERSSPHLGFVRPRIELSLIRPRDLNTHKCRGCLYEQTYLIRETATRRLNRAHVAD